MLAPASATMINGSSPRMWGTPGQPRMVDLPDRFIPTHVGNSLPVHASRYSTSVHPHACGELGDASTTAYWDAGSSPRMWGTRCRRVVRFCQYRFIPTHVGNSRFAFGIMCSATVHPHACGELGAPLIFSFASIGSSPRMWGTQCGPGSDRNEFRFIPTHVGNSQRQRSGSGLLPVHPHACGELPVTYPTGSENVGSSPRMWGTLIRPQLATRRCRFIPTHVGNSPWVSPSRCRSPVHPHACGELC